MNLARKDGTTPLIIAAFSGCVEAVEVLLKSGARVDQKYSEKNAYEWACQKKHHQVLKVFDRYCKFPSSNKS